MTEEKKKRNKGWDNIKPYQKGHPGGPGRPKGAKNFKTYLQEILDMKLKGIDPFTQKERKIANSEKLALKLFQLAEKGNLKAIEMAVDRLEGKPVQNLALKDITDEMSDQEATEHYLEEIKNPDISVAHNEKNRGD